MKIVRYIYIVLLNCLLFGGGGFEGMAQTRKKAPKKTKTQHVRAASRYPARTQSSTQRSKAMNSQRRGKAPHVQAEVSRRAVSFEEVRQERKHRDSFRLHNGGTHTLEPLVELLPVEIEPLMARFRRGDTTLLSNVIAQLYYSNHSKRGAGSFLHQIEQEADASIASARYGEALRTVRRGLLRNPMYFAFLKRACDLAQHERDPEVDVYLWQLVELFVVVEGSGDGKTPKTAFDVMGVSDALLFETLWMETPREEIKRRDLVTIEGDKQLLVLEIGPQDKRVLRHYRLPKSI